LPSRCNVSGPFKGFRISFTQPEKAVMPTPVASSSNIFDALTEDSGDADKFSTPARSSLGPSSPPPLYRKKAPAPLSIDLCPDEASLNPTVGRGMKPVRFDWDYCPDNVTIRTKPRAKPICWADMSDDDDDDTPGPWSKLDAW
jgi:hypothetical protein